MQQKISEFSEAVDQIESNPTLKTKVINALKAGGTETFKEAVNHPLVNILLATIKGWQRRIASAFIYLSGRIIERTVCC